MFVACGVCLLSMATTTTNIQPDPIILPYRTLPAIPNADSPYPLGEMRFSNTGGLIDEAASGNDQKAAMLFKLPTNYAYALIEVNLAMTYSLEAANWQDSMQCYWSNTGANPGKNHSPFVCNSTGEVFNGTGKCWSSVNIPTGIVSVPPGNAGTSQLQIDLYNYTIDGTDSFLMYNIRVLYYSIGQALATVVNTPALIR